jgi:hypothetical protein
VYTHKNSPGEDMSSLQDNKIKNLSLPGVLKTISDDKSFEILQLIANINSNGEIILKKYYSKISAMTKASIISRRSKRYYLTPFGKVIYCCTMIAKNALDNYYNLKAIEATEVSGLPNEQIGKLIDLLIDNPQVKEFVTKQC